jgi:hypothetical protein
MTTRGDRGEPMAPPGGGRWDHETMREASQRPVVGPASTDNLAASGGLELPAHESHPAPHSGAAGNEPIVGERDASTLTARWAGAMGGRPSGADTPPSTGDVLLDADTKHDRELEGGGRRERRAR